MTYLYGEPVKAFKKGDQVRIIKGRGMFTLSQRQTLWVVQEALSSCVWIGRIEDQDSMVRVPYELIEAANVLDMLGDI